MATRLAPLPLPDAQQREAALDPVRSFIVQAPAGAGKTDLLTRRLLALLARVQQPEAILALTFTKKAEAEMRARVLGCLRGVDKHGQPLAADMEHLAAAAWARDQAQGWRLAENPARLRLQTIDSFALGLTAQAPLASGLTRRTPLEDADPFYRRAARELLGELDRADAAAAQPRADLACLLAHLDNHWPRLEDLLVAMLARRDQWLPLLGAGHAVPELRTTLEQALQNAIRAALQTARAAFPPELEAEALALAEYAASHMPDASASNPAAAGLAAFPGTEPGDLPAWLGFAAIFLKQDGLRRQNVNKNQGFPSDNAGAKEMKARWKAVCAQLGDNAIAALAALRDLPATAYTDAQWEVLSALLRLLPRAAAHLDMQFQKQGATDFIACAAAARQALGDNAVPSEIAFAWDARLEHLLVDEFQDTSQSQFHLLLRLTGGWQPDDGRTVFLVGDPMQSIYGFREASVGLFLRLWSSGRWGELPITPLQLSANFRSAAELTGWFNLALAAAFPAQPDAVTGAVTYAPCQAVPPRGATPQAAEVQFLRLPWVPGAAGGKGWADRDTETAAVVRLVQQAQANSRSPTGTGGDGDADIAILVRAKHHARDILGALAAAGIPAESGLDRLGDRPAVLDLLALTRALLRSADRVAWLAILRAPWCGLTLADLLALSDGDPEAAVWDNCQDPARGSRLSPAGRVNLDRCRPVLAAALAACGREPLHRLVEGTWIALGGPSVLRPGQSTRDFRDARAFLELLASLESGGEIDLEELEDRAKGLAALPVPESGAVKVMTIHQAKGLEFATVILPQLDRPPGEDDPPLLAWQDLPSLAGTPADLLLAPIHGPGEKEPTYEYLRHLARRQREQESVRLLYVAATRAKHRLYLLGGWKPDGQPDRRSLAALLCPQGIPPAPAIQLEPSPEPAVALPAVELRRLPAGWRAPAPPPAAVAGVEPELESGQESERPSYHWVRPLARHVGVVVHAWLAAAAGLSSPAPWPASVIRRRLAQEGVAAADLAAASARAEAAIARVLADERGRWLLAPHEDDQREWALAGVADAGLTDAGITGAGVTGATATASLPAARHIRIDRSFFAQGQRWIADYKLSVHEGGDLAAFLTAQQERYRPQLETYAALLAAADLEPHPVRLGLYFPLVEENGHPAWRSWSWPRAATAPGI